MKKYYYTLIAMAVCMTVKLYAQNSAVTKAETYMTEGKLDLAKEQIDLAVAHEKTMNKGRTYYIKGNIYQSIFLSKEDKYKNLAQNPELIAFEAYKKVYELEGKNSIIRANTEIEMENFYRNVLNKGAESYQSNDYKQSQSYFNTSTLINPKDTTGFLYLNVVALQNQDYPVAKNACAKLLELKYEKADIYKNLIYIARAIDRDETKALELVQTAKQKFPNDKSIAQEEINILISTNRTDEAKNKLTESITKDPSNPSLYYTLAYMNEQTKNLDDAIVNYKKAIELKPDYFEACYNLGVLYYNKAADILKEVNSMNMERYKKEGKKMEAEGAKQLEYSLPYFEKAYELNNTDAAIIETLYTVYTRLNKTAEAAKMKKVLDAKK